MKRGLARIAAVSVAVAGLGLVTQAPAAAKEVPCQLYPRAVRVHSLVGQTHCFDQVGVFPVSIPAVFRVEAGRHAGAIVLTGSVVRFNPSTVVQVNPPSTAIRVHLTR